MASIVDRAFNIFIEKCVNLDKDVVEKSRQSKVNLLDNIAKLSGKDEFFNLYPDINIQFGSFAKKTKCRPLDDIDLMIGIKGDYATYNECNSWDDIEILSSNKSYCQYECSDFNFSGNTTLNSTKVLNRFKSELAKLPEYQKSDVKKNGEAITLNLKSKEWSFDIVPCFITEPENDGRTYYLIPNGKGKWMKTDPRIDKNRIAKLRSEHGDIMLTTIRLFKYWNNYAKMVTLDGYVAESLILQYFENCKKKGVSIKIEFYNVLEYVMYNIYNVINDPKGIQGNLNNLTNDEQRSISDKIAIRLGIMEGAISAEYNENDFRKAINLWRNIFGDEFPKYEDLI